MTRRTFWVAVGLVVAVAAAVAAVGVTVEPPPEPAPAPAAAEVQPVGGTWVCPIGDGRDAGDLRVTLARPPGTGDEPAFSDLEVFEDRERRATTLPRLFPEAALTRSPTVGPDGAIGVSWRAAPVTVQREWVLDDDDLPPGIVAGGCVEPLAERWTIPGMVTSGGSQALLRIANPFPSDATIRVSFVGTDGPVSPLALRNLSVAGRSTLEIDVNEYLPERDDLAAVVEVATGRIAVQGVQLVRSAIGGIDGVSVLDAATEPAEAWTVPWVVDRADAASWLWIYNPGDRLAPVELSYHTEDGGVMPDGLTEVLVEPGQLRRVDLRGTLPEDLQVVAVTARSDGAPVVLSAAVELGGEDVERTAFTVQLGVPRTDGSWTVSGGSTEDRFEQLHLVNPGSEDATASVSLFTGVTVERPDELQAVTVPAGASRIVEVADGARALAGWTAFVTVEGGELVVGRVGGSEAGPRRQVTVAGMASWQWQTRTAGTTVVREDGMVQRLRTSLGIAAADRIGALIPEVGTPIEPAPPDAPAPSPDEPDETPPLDDPGEAPPTGADEPPTDAMPDDGDVPDDDAELPSDGEVADDEAGDEEPVRELPGDGSRAGLGDGDDDDGDGDGDEGTADGP